MIPPTESHGLSTSYWWAKTRPQPLIDGRGIGCEVALMIYKNKKVKCKISLS